MRNILKIALLVAVIAAVHFLYGWGNLFALVRDFAERDGSPWVFLLLASTCAFGFSLSASNMMAGAAFGIWYGWGLSLVGLAISCSIGFLLGRFLVPQSYIEKLRGRLKISDSANSRMFQLNFFVRVFPGIPYTAQNIVLGGMRSDFKMYFAVNMVAQGAIALFGNLAGYLLAQGTESKLYWLAIIPLVVLLFIAHKIMHRFYRKAKKGLALTNKNGPSNTEGPREI